MLDNNYNTTAQPDWAAASAELADQLHQLSDLDSRVVLLEMLCNRLGTDMYPAFLQLLFLVEQQFDTTVQKQLTDTLAYAMSTGRLPSGTLPAWGSTSTTRQSPYSSSRALGPIEFLCAWYAQATELPQLNDATFDEALSTLLRLLDSNRTARKLYCYNLNMDAINGSIGTFSSATRAGIAKLAKEWNAKGCSTNLAAQFISDIKSCNTF